LQAGFKFFPAFAYLFIALNGRNCQVLQQIDINLMVGDRPNILLNKQVLPVAKTALLKIIIDSHCLEFPVA
jgi:hypothetical protein